MLSSGFCEIFEHLFFNCPNTRTPVKSAKDSATFEDSEQREKLENLLKASNYLSGQYSLLKEMVEVFSQVFCRINTKADFQTSTTKIYNTIKYLISMGEMCKVF